MKTIFLILLLLFSVNFSEAKNYYSTGEIIKDNFNLNKKIKFELSKGDWTIISQKKWNYHGLNLKSFSLVKTEKEELKEYFEVLEFDLGGIVIGQIDPILYEIVFKNKYDGCYEKPKYFIIKFFSKGSTHNCFWVGHENLYDQMQYPEDPELRGAYVQELKWFKQNSINFPKILLYRSHSYFSRSVSSKWYVINHFIDPKKLDSLNLKFFSEERSEFHKYNIDDYPKHKEVMDNWISFSAIKHKDFEKKVKAKKKHFLNLTQFINENNENNDSVSNKIAEQLEKLNNLYKSGALTKKEFEKAKAKILDY